MHFRRSFSRSLRSSRSSLSSRSSTASLSDSDSIISTLSGNANANGNTDDDTLLWHRMLTLQRQFHCYNSARMSAALQDESMAVPPRACLDLLNDSIATEELCSEARAQVDLLMLRGEPVRRPRSFWRRRLD